MRSPFKLIMTRWPGLLKRRTNLAVLATASCRQGTMCTHYLKAMAQTLYVNPAQTAGATCQSHQLHKSQPGVHLRLLPDCIQLAWSLMRPQVSGTTRLYS